jgi:hypothetical protein
LVQPPALTVYKYVTVTGAVVVLTNVSLGLPVPDPMALLMPPTVALFQINTAPEVVLVGT